MDSVAGYIPFLRLCYCYLLFTSDLIYTTRNFLGARWHIEWFCSQSLSGFELTLGCGFIRGFHSSFAPLIL